MHLNHTNFDVSADEPKAGGDRYWAHDLIRDFQYLRGQIGLLTKTLLGMNPIIHSSGFDTTDNNTTAFINEIAGVVKTTIRVPNDAAGWTIPMTYKDEDIYVIAHVSQKTLTFPNGSGYIRLKYIAQESLTRQKVFKNETYNYFQTDNADLITSADDTAVNGELVIASYSDAGTDDFAITELKNQIQTAINLKADDTAVMHKTGDETINGEKTFTNTKLASPVLTGTPTIPDKTTAPVDDGTLIASEAQAYSIAQALQTLTDNTATKEVVDTMIQSLNLSLDVRTAASGGTPNNGLNTNNYPYICGGIIQINSKIYKFEQYKTIGGTSTANITNYVYAYPNSDESAILFEFDTDIDPPVWNAVKNGWYHSTKPNYRAVLKFFKITTQYNGKVILDNYDAMYRVNTHQPLPTSGGIEVETLTLDGVKGNKSYTTIGAFRYELTSGAIGFGGIGGAGGTGGTIYNYATGNVIGHASSGVKGMDGFGDGESRNTVSGVFVWTSRGVPIRVYSGGNGDDGGDGKKGADGVDNTSTSDATAGGNGGNGGDGGYGEESKIIGVATTGDNGYGFIDASYDYGADGATNGADGNHGKPGKLQAAGTAGGSVKVYRLW